jgi:predicted nucleic acid-binding protein
MRIYLDTCTIQRPLDDRSQPRVALEAAAITAILGQCEQGSLTLVVSDITRFETSRNPFVQRQLFANSIIDAAGEYVSLNAVITQRATTLEQKGIAAIDALHLASAEYARVDVFCTCDDRFYRKGRLIPDCAVRIVTPLELAQEILP